MSGYTASGIRKITLIGVVGLLFFLSCPRDAWGPAAATGAVRPAAVAGRFYPAEPGALEKAVRAYLAEARPARGPRPVALIAPHAGYIYSGQIAADAWRQLSGHEYDLVVILGVNHTTSGFDKVSIFDGSGYRTPLGVAKIDQEAAGRLRNADERFTFHAPVHQSEHSVEVHVPFAQVALPGVPILPVVIGRPDPDLCLRLGRALAKTLEGRRALLVASSDLSHYPAYEDAVEADRATLASMAELDAERLLRTIKAEMARGRAGLSTCACGEGPVLALLEAAKALGAGKGTVISYANSGDTALGDRSRVVGYGAVVFAKGPEAADLSALRPPVPADTTSPLSRAERDRLLEIARSSIRRYLETRTAPLVRDLPPSLRRPQGIFVTLKEHGQLRGCIGRRDPSLPLGQVVGAIALQAAFNDRRFQPVGPEEMEAIEIDISLLTPLKEVPGPEAIQVGRDGVLLSKGGRSAIFLPEVPVENGWSRDEMLDHLARKAGLPVGAWKSGATFQTFQSEVIREKDPGD